MHVRIHKEYLSILMKIMLATTIGRKNHINLLRIIHIVCLAILENSVRTLANFLYCVIATHLRSFGMTKFIGSILNEGTYRQEECEGLKHTLSYRKENFQDSTLSTERHLPLQILHGDHVSLINIKLPKIFSSTSISYGNFSKFSISLNEA